MKIDDLTKWETARKVCQTSGLIYHWSMNFFRMTKTIYWIFQIWSNRPHNLWLYVTRSEDMGGLIPEKVFYKGVLLNGTGLRYIAFLILKEFLTLTLSMKNIWSQIHFLSYYLTLQGKMIQYITVCSVLSLEIY